MVTRINFRLIIFFLIFFKIQGTLNSQDKMKDIEININQALESYKSKKLKIIDIRTLKEWKMTGIIPNSYLINMHEEDFSENLNFIAETEKLLNEFKEFDIAFICASGARSEIAANYFIEKDYKNIFHIPDGILGKNKDGWLFLGYPIESYIEK